MTASRYHRVAMFLHWAIAGMIVVQFILARLVGRTVTVAVHVEATVTD